MAQKRAIGYTVSQKVTGISHGSVTTHLRCACLVLWWRPYYRFRAYCSLRYCEKL